MVHGGYTLCSFSEQHYRRNKAMKKIILSVAAVTLVASALATAPLGSTWGVQPLPTDGFHGSLGGGANELVGYQAGPMFTADGTVQGSYGFQNGMVVYGNVLGSRSFDALPNTPNDGNTSRTGNNINTLFTTLGMQKSLTPNLLVGAQITYGNYALAPASNVVTVDGGGTTSVPAPGSWWDTAGIEMGNDPLGTEGSGFISSSTQEGVNSYVNWVNEVCGTHIIPLQYQSGITTNSEIENFNVQVINALSLKIYGVADYTLLTYDQQMNLLTNQLSILTASGSNSPKLNFKTVGFGFNPYAQYTFGQSTVYGSYTLQELQNSGMQTIVGYTGSGVGHNFTGGYSYAMTPDLTVGLSGAYQIVNQPYTYAALVQYANSNNYQAAIGSEDYISIMPGVNYNISAIQGLSVGLNTGLNWFNFRKCNAPANGYANFMSAFVFTPSVNYQIPLAQNFVWSSNAQYNGVKMINASNPETGASMNGQTLNSSFQVTTGLTYSF